MCHTIDYYHHRHRQHDRLIRLKSIALHLSLSSVSTTTTAATAAAAVLLPETLTFVFLPRINGTPLTINTSTFPSDSPAFISLHHRTLHSSAAVFTSDDRVSFSDGAVFEVHLGENRLIHGVFRRSSTGNPRTESKYVAERDFGVNEAVIITAEENGAVVREKVKVTAVKKRRHCRRKYAAALVEIPEERECDVAEDDIYDDVEGYGVDTCCGDCEGKCESDGGYEFDEKMMETEMEGVRWAVDVGIWAVCIGVGLLVSKASIRSFTRRRKFV